MAEPDVFQLADRALARVVAQIAPEQWEMILPASFTTRARPEPPSLRTLDQLPRLRRRLGARHAGRAHHGRGGGGQVRRRPPG